MKNLIVLIFFFLGFLGFSQEINFKKGIVSIDGKECLKYDSDSNNVTYQNMKGDDIIILKYIRPDGTQNSLYVKVIFVDTNQELTTKFIFSKKLLIEKLLKSNALVNCELDEDKLKVFIMKFDEKVEDKLNNNTNTIIIKEEQRRSGVNINIGR